MPGRPKPMDDDAEQQPTRMEHAQHVEMCNSGTEVCLQCSISITTVLPPPLFLQINLAINEDNLVQDTASEELRVARMRVKALQARLTSLLKGYGGEVSERGGRLCVAVPAGAAVASLSALP